MLDDIDWGSLKHAYGRATDTRAHIVALTETDPEAWEVAIDHLYVAVLHQGFPEKATAPAARVLTHLLAEGDIAPGARAAVIEYLGAVADATAMAEEEKYWRRLLPGLQEAIRQSCPVVFSFLDNEDPRLRNTAGEAAVSHVKTLALAEEKPVVIALLRRWADHLPTNRARWVLRLGELGDDIQWFLTHPDTDVRVCAALAESVAHSETATDIIITALSDEADRLRQAGTPEPDDGPVDSLEEYATAVWEASTRLYSLADLVSAALARAGFHRIAEPAMTIIRHSNWTLVDTTWGPLVRAAFPTHRRRRRRRAVERPVGLSAVQRDVVAALVANPRIWDYQNGNVSSVFMDAGLPFERETCAQIARES
ncbi:hypothetical protein [Actinophytocola sp.]|uniref:hypothetical protein n=1 Tax=Actinophytocola sp. TaxID=1872138 RepID=UPI002ED34943